MEIAISRHNVVISEILKATVEEKVTRLARFLGGLERADVQFSEERNPRIPAREVCEVVVQAGGVIVRAHAAAPDALAALDLVIDKIEHRLEKLKGKQLVRSHPRRPGSVDFDAGSAPAPRSTNGYRIDAT